MAINLRIRGVVEADVPVLAALYAGVVRTLGPQRYSPEQVAAWSAFAMQSEAFRKFVMGPTTFVAEDEAGVAGFAGIEPTGRVASLYVHGERTRQGAGALLLRAVLDHARREGMNTLHTEASEFSRALFARFGFVVRETETTEYNGVIFVRYKMVLEHGEPR